MKQRFTQLFFLLLLSPVFLNAQTGTLEFVANKGQWDGPFLYKSVGANSAVFLEKGGFTYRIASPANSQLIHDIKHNKKTDAATLKFHAYKVLFEGANPAVTLKESKVQKHYYNYYLGNDPTKWKSEIYPTQNVDYESIYPGVDLHVASEKGQLKYDFIVKAGADPNVITMRYEGTDGLDVKKGNLEVKTSVGTITEMQPYAYQYVGGEKKEVSCRYVLRGDKVMFHFPKGYDKNSTLIIDPVVVFATYSGSTADNWGFTATYDNQGNFYAGGISDPSVYPTTPGAFQTTFGGGGSGSGNPQMNWDIAITKFNPTGTTQVFSTYLGGADNEQPHSMIVDNNHNLVVAGRTYSANFPMQNAYDNSYNGNADIIVTKFNAAGSTLLGSTYMGGSQDDGVNISSLWSMVTDLKHNYGDDARSEVIVDNAGNVYVAASTTSPDFPLANATQSGPQGGQDGVVFKLNSNLSSLTWSTYLGGSGNDAAYVLALNVAQSHLFVSGGTASTNFPSTSGTFQPNYRGGSADGFIVKFQNSGTYPLQRGTFIGEPQYDQCYGVQVDNLNRVYSMGQTHGGTFPVTPGVYSNPGSSQFVIKLDSNLTTNIYSTVFGSGTAFAANISPVAFLVDTCEQVYISGWGGPLAGNGGTVNNMPVSPNAVKATTDGQDFYFIVLAKDAANLLYATYYGGNGLGEHVDGGTSRFDKNGVVYQGICAGCGASNAFPTTPGVWSNTNNSANCNYGALKIEFQLSVVNATASVAPDSSGCPPFTVNFINNSTNGASYLWDFGDGSPTTTVHTPPAHVYTNPGVYKVKLVVSNPGACNVTVDSTEITIRVDSNIIKADFNYQITDSCKPPYTANFTNASDYSSTPGSQNFTQFIWDFDDGSPLFNGANPGTHVFPDTGCYTIRMVMIDTTACNPRDTVEKTVCLNGYMLKAAFNADSTCQGSGLLFSNLSVNGQTYQWSFGEGGTSNAHSPVYTYDSSGVFDVKLIVTNPNTCNKIDSTTMPVKIMSLPVANFTYDPIFPTPNLPTKFTNRSINAVSYNWSFGDGTSTAERDPEHQWKKSGTYDVCLTARSIDGCVDTLCKKVDAEIYPAVDVPTGFSPNGDNVNDVLYVKGAAIETMHFRVYNRWGQMVFESKDLKTGWDGTYKGKLQEMEAYAWVLDVVFIDESTAHKTGNVTLLR